MHAKKKVRRPVKQVIGPFWSDQDDACPTLLKSLVALQLYDPREEEGENGHVSHENLGEFVTKIPQDCKLVSRKCIKSPLFIF